MSTKSINITDVFEAKTCDLCGNNELSQFFGINENFIEYCGVYYPFREILSESLNFHISKEDGKSMEICLDCKDKTLKFYHFKRKVKEGREYLHKSTNNNRKKPQDTQKYSKIVCNIYRIIENYTEQCAITKIQINTTDRALIIESSEKLPQKSKRKEAKFDENCEEEMQLETAIIKEEFRESNVVNETENNYDEYCESSYILTTHKSEKPFKKKLKTENSTKRLKDTEQEIGTLDLSVMDVINAFDVDSNKFNDKYGDIFRRLMLEKYQTRIVVNFSYIGKSKLRVTVRCEKCRDTYKIEADRQDFISKTVTQCVVRSTRTDFCKCGYRPKNQSNAAADDTHKNQGSEII